MKALLNFSISLSKSLVTQPNQIAFQQIRCGHWFSKYYKNKRIFRPLSQEVMLKYREAVQEKMPDPKSVPSLLQSYFDDDTPESVKTMYSFEHLGLEVAIEEVIKQRLAQVGLEPNDGSTAAKVIELTVRLRMLREQAAVKWSKSMERQLLQWMEQREALLKDLRSEDYNKFLEVLDQMQLQYQHQKPAHITEHSSKFSQRLKETRDRCQKLKQLRLQKLTEQLQESKQDFDQKKADKLNELQARLNDLGLSLNTVLDEVYKERRKQASDKLLHDNLNWYYAEQYAARNEARRIQLKMEAAANKGRK